MEVEQTQHQQQQLPADDETQPTAAAGEGGDQQDAPTSSSAAVVKIPLEGIELDGGTAEQPPPHAPVLAHKDDPSKKLYWDRSHYSSPYHQRMALQKSSTLYVGNLSFDVKTHHLRTHFAQLGGPVRKIIMGLDRMKKTPCGFCFVEYYERIHALQAVSLLSGTKLDGKVIRVELDAGFQDGRQYGRGVSGGQVRDDRRRRMMMMGGSGGKRERDTTTTTTSTAAAAPAPVRMDDALPSARRTTIAGGHYGLSSSAEGAAAPKNEEEEENNDEEDAPPTKRRKMN